MAGFRIGVWWPGLVRLKPSFRGTSAEPEDKGLCYVAVKVGESEEATTFALKEALPYLTQLLFYDLLTNFFALFRCFTFFRYLPKLYVLYTVVLFPPFYFLWLVVLTSIVVILFPLEHVFVSFIKNMVEVFYKQRVWTFFL